MPASGSREQVFLWSQLEHFLGTAVGKSPGMSFTDSFVAADRPEPKAVSREAWRKMVMIFADHLRDQKRQDLRKAVAICISLDDKSNLADAAFKF